jgi:hypothetical protein
VTVPQADAIVAAARLNLLTSQAYGRERDGDRLTLDRDAEENIGFPLPHDWTRCVQVQANIFAPGEASYPAALENITPLAYREHQANGNTLNPEQLAALDRMKQYTDFNDLATKSTLGQERLDCQLRSAVDAVIAKRDQLVVDITADQFADGPGPVVVVENSEWHRGFHVVSNDVGDFREYLSWSVACITT